MHFEDGNRRFTHGTITLIDTDGSKRPLTITAAGPTGFHLGTTGYYGWNDWVYGQWVGDLKVEGGTGLGNAETFAMGAFPERGLTAENSFL